MSESRSNILQFGTSRFLQAHADFFIGQALRQGKAVGTVTVVQTTSSPDSAARVEAFNRLKSYPVLVRGLENGTVVDRREEIASIERALQADRDWPEIVTFFVARARFVISNTGDKGYLTDAMDRLEGAPPRSFPAKLVSLLWERYSVNRRAITFLPCELLPNNGSALRDLVAGLAADWKLPAPFVQWVRESCVWANSLVDRIVSEPLEPIGAVAEPYALWAIQHQPGLELPCEHPCIQVVEDLDKFELLKLGILNLGHTFLVSQWMKAGRPDIATVLDAMNDGDLYGLWRRVQAEEVLPIFAAIGLENEAREYARQVEDRFRNPFLKHKLGDIASNHEQKLERRIAPMVARAREVTPGLKTPLLESCLLG